MAQITKPSEESPQVSDQMDTPTIPLHQHKFELDVVQALAALKGDTKGIVDRLTILTDLVERHESRMEDLEKGISAHQSHCPLAVRVAAIETQLATATASALATQRANKQWEDRVTPVLKTLGLLIAGMILGRGPELLKLLR